MIQGLNITFQIQQSVEGVLDILQRYVYRGSDGT